jgi:L-threonylcarbamoyladenylate synthase
MTQIILEKKINILDLVAWLKQGRVIAMPTETAYGLIAVATNSLAIKKIYQIKGRNFKKPLPVICSSLAMVKKFFYLPQFVEDIVKKHWPGDLSVRLKIKNISGGKKMKISYDGTGVVRVSSNKLLQSLTRKLGEPITATSANISGKGELYSGQAVGEHFKKRHFLPDIIVDGGLIPFRKPSTIISLEDKSLVVLRQGEIKIKL